MLEMQHKRFDVAAVKCCFFSTMKLHWQLLASGILAVILASCTAGPGGRSNSLGEMAPRFQSRGADSRISDSEAFAAPKKERPGLATTWGNTVKSPMPSTSFQRASSKPAGVDAIYYNNREGLEAMGGMDSRVDPLQKAAGEMVEWGIRGELGYLPAYQSYMTGGYRHFVKGSAGSTYSIVVKNRCKSALQIVLSVDGLDVIDGKPGSVQKRGYVVQAGETLEVKGFRVGYHEEAEFKFSSVNNSYANLSRGETRNVGVIGMAVFTQAGVDPWTWMPKEVEKRNTASPFAQM